MTFTKIINLFDRTEERQVRQLALAAEVKVHRLSGSDARYFDREQDLILILTSLNKLLDRLLALWQDRATDGMAESTTIVRHHKPDRPPRPESAIALDPDETAIEHPTPILPQSPAPQLSPAAAGTIELRDWLLLATSSTDSAANAEIEPQILTVIDDKLPQILEREGIVEIVDTSRFDYTRHQIVETRPTTEPERHETIAQTMTPGYLHHDRVIRPQAVIVYILAPKNSAPVA